MGTFDTPQWNRFGDLSVKDALANQASSSGYDCNGDEKRQLWSLSVHRGRECTLSLPVIPPIALSLIPTACRQTIRSTGICHCWTTTTESELCRPHQRSILPAGASVSFGVLTHFCAVRVTAFQRARFTNRDFRASASNGDFSQALRNA